MRRRLRIGIEITEIRTFTRLRLEQTVPKYRIIELLLSNICTVVGPFACAARDVESGCIDNADKVRGGKAHKARASGRE
jgi:hypothetical protein